MYRSMMKSVLLIVFALIFLCGESFAYTRDKLGPINYQKFREACDGQMPVYYDYVEDGELKGGIATVEVPEVFEFGVSEFESGANGVWDFETILPSGGSANRIDIVTVGDGYMESDLSTYKSQVRTTLHGYFLEKPLNVYKNYFNIHRVDVISNESGVDEPDNNIYRDTALDMNYNCGGTARLLCVSTSKAFAAAESAPEVDQVLVLANSSRYGGAGYSNLATLAGGNGSSVGLALHEFGHSFGKLADEYTYGGDETYTGSEPSSINVSIYTASEQVALQRKWYRWMDLPNVDTFEGAKYSKYGIYRPTYSSKMRSLSSPFGEVNVEQIIFQIYSYVSPIDEATSESAGLLADYTEFYVVPVEPVGHSLDIQWSIDGVEVEGATGETFRPDSLRLADGEYVLSVKVVDNTSMVRDETKRASLMSESRSWRFAVVNADLSEDRRVNWVDFAMFAGHWLDEGCVDAGTCGGADLSGDGEVGIDDLWIIGESWLTYYGSLAARIEFDNDMSDSVGFHPVVGHNGAAVSNADGDFVVGTGALDLDGADDYLSIEGLGIDLAGKDFTFTAWVRSKSVETAQFILGINTSTSANRLLAGHMEGRTYLQIYENGWKSTSATVFDGAWHFVAISLNDSENEVRVYVDGELVHDHGTIASIREGDKFSIGQEYDSGFTPSDFFNGFVDDVRFYKHVLTIDEVVELWQ